MKENEERLTPPLSPHERPVHVLLSLFYQRTSDADGPDITTKLMSLESEATPSATPFFKRAYKISLPPRL